MSAASGGVSEVGLRQFWRGRIGLSKDEQLQVLAPLLHLPPSVQRPLHITTPW